MPLGNLLSCLSVWWDSPSRSSLLTQCRYVLGSRPKNVQQVLGAGGFFFTFLSLLLPTSWECWEFSNRCPPPPGKRPPLPSLWHVETFSLAQIQCGFMCSVLRTWLVFDSCPSQRLFHLHVYRATHSIWNFHSRFPCQALCIAATIISPLLTEVNTFILLILFIYEVNIWTRSIHGNEFLFVILFCHGNMIWSIS